MTELVAEVGVGEGDQGCLLAVVVLMRVVGPETTAMTGDAVVYEVEEVARITGVACLEHAQTVRASSVEVAHGMGVERVRVMEGSG